MDFDELFRWPESDSRFFRDGNGLAGFWVSARSSLARHRLKSAEPGKLNGFPLDEDLAKDVDHGADDLKGCREGDSPVLCKGACDVLLVCHDSTPVFGL